MKSNLWLFVLVAAVLFGVTGCGRDEGGGASDGSATGVADAPTQHQAGYASGRVTMEDGSPPRGDIRDIAINIHGVSEAAEKVSYAPAVKPDGTYRQKLAPGQYRFDPAAITVAFNNHVFRLPLEPTGQMWNKDRDAAEGIAQDFVWKVTGPTARHGSYSFKVRATIPTTSRRCALPWRKTTSSAR